MRIDVGFNPGPFDELGLRERHVVVIDVLRASTTITVALAYGAREIIPVASIESAVKISGSLFGEVTLRGGERNGKMIEGFNLGNSPLEYTEAMVRGKSIIFCSTNGSVAMAKSRYAKSLVIGSFVNLSAVVNHLAERREDVLLLCAGRSNAPSQFSLEDSVCAGMIVSNLDKILGLELHLSDGARAVLALHKTYGRSPLKLLRSTEHGEYLTEIGFAADLKLCATVDAVPYLPLLHGTSIKLRKDDAELPSERVGAA
jgi:2-phosphosulfolactate phosphatase